MKIWFDYEAEIKEEVKNYLISQKYNPREPNFDENFIAVKKLKDADIFVLEKNHLLKFPYT